MRPTPALPKLDRRRRQSNSVKLAIPTINSFFKEQKGPPPGQSRTHSAPNSEHNLDEHNINRATPHLRGRHWLKTPHNRNITEPEHMKQFRHFAAYAQVRCA